LKEAQGLLEEMPAADRSVYSHSLLIHAAEKAGDWRAAQGVLERMSCRGLVPSVACYGSTMNALGKAGRAEEALALLRRMGTGGEPRPNAVAYTTAIDACARRSLASEALGLLREMEEERGLAPNPVAYACAMNACAKDRRGLEALRLLREMQAKGLAATEAHYGAVLNALNLSEEDDASLLALYAEAQDRRLPQHVSMHGAAIKAGDRMGASDRVISVGRDMLRDGHRPNQRALKLLVYHAYAGGAYQEGVAFFHAREEGYVQNASIIKLVLRCAEKIGDVETVLLCIKEAESKKEWMCRTASRIINREEAEEIRGRQAREGEKREVRRRAVAELKVMLKEWTYEAGKQAQGLEEKVRSKDRRLAVFLRTTRKKGRTGL
jgi:pentatricopeptide repeat protein